MVKHLVVTGDGSHSVMVQGMNVSYHSKHGAITESLHVFIDAGLKYVAEGFGDISVLEIGFGTGLNSLLTLMAVHQKDLKIDYTTIELYPLDQELVSTLNYIQVLGRQDLQQAYTNMHICEGGCAIRLSANFTFMKMCEDVRDVVLEKRFDLIYFDAFDPVSQPELWTKEVIKLTTR